MPGKSFDPVADAYDATRRLPDPLMTRAVDALASILGPGFVLEAGVGTGRFAVPLRARGVRVVGADIAPRMLAAARAKGGGDLFLADATRLPFRDLAFSSSLAIHLLHLVAEWRLVLAELARVTRDRFVTLHEKITTRPLDGGQAVAGFGPGDVYHPVRRYEELAAERGYRYEHPGVRTPEMTERVPPSVRVPVGVHTEVVSGEALLAPAAAKTYSSQWAVPDDVHRAVIDALTTEMTGRTYERTWEVEVVGWPPEALLRI